MSNYVIRSKHDKENPYSQINKKLIRDNNLSFKARGLLIYLLSFPDDWKIQVSQIAKDNLCGHESIYSGLNELKNLGYVKFYQLRDEKGGFSNSYYEFSEEPIFKEKVPQPQNPDAGFPNPDNAEHTKECVPQNIVPLKDTDSIPISNPDPIDSLIEKYELRITEKTKSVWKFKFLEKDILNALNVLVMNLPKENHESYMEALFKKKAKPANSIDNFEENKKWAQYLEKTFQGGCVKFEALNKGVEIFMTSGNQTPWCLGYSENGFKEQVENQLRKYRFR